MWNHKTNQETQQNRKNHTYKEKQVAVREKSSGLTREIDERDGEVKNFQLQNKCVTGMTCTVWRIL